jgi:hypothetical protein
MEADVDEEILALDETLCWLMKARKWLEDGRARLGSKLRGVPG